MVVVIGRMVVVVVVDVEVVDVVIGRMCHR